MEGPVFYFRVFNKTVHFELVLAPIKRVHSLVGGSALIERRGQLASGAKRSTFDITSIRDIKKTTIRVRLRTMERIWDSLCHEEAEPESPSWDETILKERKQMMDSAETKYLTIEQLRKRYR